MSEQKTALQTALGLLERKAYTVQELTNKLFRKTEFTEQEILEAVQKLEEMGFLSDRKYTEDFVRILRGRGYGDNRIFEKLTFKGIDAELAHEILNSAERERDPFEDAMTLLERRARRLDRIEDPQKRNHRILCMLAGRGFSPDVAYRVLAAWDKRPRNDEE